MHSRLLLSMFCHLFLCQRLNAEDYRLIQNLTPECDSECCGEELLFNPKVFLDSAGLQWRARSGSLGKQN